MARFIPLLITLLAMGSMFALVMALRRIQANKRLSSVGTAMGRTNAPRDMREIKLEQPWSERVLKPLLRRLYRLGRYLTPSRNIEQLQHNLIVAGLPAGLTVTDFLGLRFLAAALLGGVVFVFFVMTDPFATALMYAGAAFLAGLYLPNFWLRGKVKRRQKSIALALPDALDMMSICVEAGLGFEAAIQKVAYQWDNDLAHEFRRVISEIRVGVPRSDALRHVVERTDVPEIASFVAVLIQADRLGIAIRNVLKTQSDQMRVRRRQNAEQQAAKAPLKMMIPLALFVFPALFAVILGPAVPVLMGTLG